MNVYYISLITTIF